MNQTAYAVDLIIMAYRDVAEERDICEISYLYEEAKKGEATLAEACRVVFGTNLSDVLFSTLKNAQEVTEHAYRYMTDDLNEGDAYTAILVARDTALASKLIFRIQRKLKCIWIAQSSTLTRSTLYYAKAIRRKLDPDGTLCPEAVEIPPQPNTRDRQREEIIYKARKMDMRSFSSIARELGISISRVCQIYRRYDRELNGENADHLQPDYPRRCIFEDGNQLDSSLEAQKL